MPAYDTNLVNFMEGPLNYKGNPTRFIDYKDLCTSFCIETPKFHKKKQYQPVRPLQERQIRQIAFQVEHLMTIMQAQLADKNEDEKIDFIMMIGEQNIKEIKQINKNENNHKKSTVSLSKSKANNQRKNTVVVVD